MIVALPRDSFVVFFSSKNMHSFLNAIHFSVMTGHSSKPNKLRYINSVRCSTRKIPILEWKMYSIKIEIAAFIINFRKKKTKPSEIINQETGS